MADLSKDTLLFARECRRMCKNNRHECKSCELFHHICKIGCANGCAENDAYLLQCVQRWHDEHPQKTYAQDFREKFPNCAWHDEKNRPIICRYKVYDGKYRCINTEKECSECWNEPMSKE